MTTPAEEGQEQRKVSGPVGIHRWEQPPRSVLLHGFSAAEERGGRLEHGET